MGFFTTGSSGTVSGPLEFDAEASCKKLYEGMRGLGTDENAVVEVIASHTNEQRQEIKDKYKTMYGKDLAEDLEGELGGSFAKIVLALMKEPEEYIIESINQAISGLGTDEYALIGLLCSRSNDELEEIKKAYKEKYDKEMEDDIAEDLSGDFRSLIVGMINGGRDESEEIDPEKVQEDAKNLLEASEGAGTREEVFQSIFNLRSYEHMRQVFDAYKELSGGKEIEELIESEFSGSLQVCYLAMVKIFRNVAEFFAERLRAAIKGAGTDDETLIRIVVLRSEVDLKDIVAIYYSKFDSTLAEEVSSDTSGDYKLILEKLLTPLDTETEVEEEITAKDAGEGEEVVPVAAEGEEAENNEETTEAEAGDGGDEANCDAEEEGKEDENPAADCEDNAENEAGDDAAATATNEDGECETKEEEAAVCEDEAKDGEAEENEAKEETATADGEEQPAGDDSAAAADDAGDAIADADGGADTGDAAAATDGVDDGGDAGAE